MIGFLLPPLPAGQVLETNVHTHGGLCHFSPDDIWFCLHPLFASDISSPFSLCPLGLPAKIFGKIFVIVFSVWVVFPPFLMLLWAFHMTDMS